MASEGTEEGRKRQSEVRHRLPPRDGDEGDDDGLPYTLPPVLHIIERHDTRQMNLCPLQTSHTTAVGIVSVCCKCNLTRLSTIFKLIMKLEC